VVCSGFEAAGDACAIAGDPMVPRRTPVKPIKPAKPINATQQRTSRYDGA